MTTVEINIIDDETLILDVLRAFEQRRLITFTNKKPLTHEGIKMSELEYEEMLNEARTTPAYNLKDAKAYLKL
ncbi:MAG: hypothetical protein EAZ32_14755 [Cytophagia bacterium]|nr:MAG: hypothetical protein EAZ38_15835 [Cytophagales bacterium]TAG37637.1 MAG: hypothetical protein EAZ32_14755 [Cytophagia bacterium]TAG78773.1 MAG: hypothetical protein EAZ22_12900 [Cytophagales bacterium]